MHKTYAYQCFDHPIDRDNSYTLLPLLQILLHLLDRKRVLRADEDIENGSARKRFFETVLPERG